MANDPQIRILHVLPRLSGGGICKWLSRVKDRIDPKRFHFDFAVHRASTNTVPDNLLSNDSRLFTLPDRKRIIAYCHALNRLLETHRYQVIHTHYHLFSLIPLAIASRRRVPIRIAHARTVAHGTDIFSRTIAYVFTNAVAKYSTHRLACSEAAARSLFGQSVCREAKHANNGHYYILPGGIEPESYATCTDFSALRRQLDIPANALVVGHVGNLLEAKNHQFLLNVFAEVLRRRPDAWLLLIGEGPLRSAIEQRARHLKIFHRVRFLGYREDVPSLFRVFDVMVFPSKWEGLLTALVEAQFSGIPAVASDRVTREVRLSDHVLFMSLSTSPSEWASSALYLAESRGFSINVMTPEVAPFTIDFHVRALTGIYEGPLCGKANNGE